jgi:hypothetical protein
MEITQMYSGKKRNNVVKNWERKRKMLNTLTDTKNDSPRDSATHCLRNFFCWYHVVLVGAI